VFWPSIHKVITLRKRRLEHDVGTFPRYLFVSGVPSRIRSRDRVGDDGQTVITVNGRPISDIREIDGVLEVVGTSVGWLKVPGQAIAAVAAYQNDSTPPEPAPKVAAGDRLIVIHGPFAGFQAEVVEAIGLDRAEVLISIFGRDTPMQIGLDHLAA
jgi:transcription antitermination factor NusG